MWPRVIWTAITLPFFCLLFSELQYHSLCKGRLFRIFNDVLHRRSKVILTWVRLIIYIYFFFFGWTIFLVLHSNRLWKTNSIPSNRLCFHTTLNLLNKSQCVLLAVQHTWRHFHSDEGLAQHCRAPLCSDLIAMIIIKTAGFMQPLMWSGKVTIHNLHFCH